MPKQNGRQEEDRAYFSSPISGDGTICSSCQMSLTKLCSLLQYLIGYAKKYNVVKLSLLKNLLQFYVYVAQNQEK